MGDSGNSRGFGAARPRRDPPPERHGRQPVLELEAGPARRELRALSHVEARSRGRRATTRRGWRRRGTRGRPARRLASPLALTGGRPGSGATQRPDVDRRRRLHARRRRRPPRRRRPLRRGRRLRAAGRAAARAPIPTELGAILATIRSMESGGDYTVSVTTSTASGAYGFLDSSWGGYGGYRRAKDAPPAVQDAKAAELATVHPRAATPATSRRSRCPGTSATSRVGAEWDTVPPVSRQPADAAGVPGSLAGAYAEFLGTPERVGRGDGAAWTPVDTPATCRTVVVDLGQPGAPQYVLTQAQRSSATPPAGPCSRRRPVRPVPLPSPRRGAERRRGAARATPVGATGASLTGRVAALGWPSCTPARRHDFVADHPRSADAGRRRRRPTCWPACRWRGCAAGPARSRCSSTRRRAGGSPTSTAIEYVDLCLGDTGAMGGHALPAVAAAVAARAAGARRRCCRRPTRRGSPASWPGGSACRRGSSR